MLTKTQAVKMRINDVSTEVGTATYPEFEAVAEAVDNLGEEKLLEKLNAQIRTDEMNRVRGLARSGPGKKALEGKALASFTAEDWQRVAGDENAIRKLLDEKIDQLRAETLKTVGVAANEDDES